jgi:hypothetical protein
LKTFSSELDNPLSAKLEKNPVDSHWTTDYNTINQKSSLFNNILTPRLFSSPFSREKKTLVGAGHVAPRIWEVKNIILGAGTQRQ